MSNERAWPFPASRALTTWWRQLARWQPRSLWIAHLLLHRVEALVHLQEACPLLPADRLLLKAVQQAKTVSLDTLADRLQLPRQLLGQVLRSRQAAGLVADNAGWSLTALGQQAVQTGQYFQDTQQRRSFAFLHRDQEPPQFLALTAACQAWTPEPGWCFDPALLDACLARPADWKIQAGFPPDVRGVVSLGEGTNALEQIIIDRPEKQTAALITTPEHRLLGFAADEESWALQAEAPILNLTEGSEAFPELAAPTAEHWRQAWDEWCQSRKIRVSGDVQFHDEGQRLRVTGSQPLREQFGKRSDVLKGEAWLLAGRGRIRRAMLIVIE